MADTVTSQTQHLTSLDFDISKALQQLEELREKFNSITEQIAGKNWSINAVINGTDGFGEMEEKAKSLNEQITQLSEKISKTPQTGIQKSTQEIKQLQAELKLLESIYAKDSESLEALQSKSQKYSEIAAAQTKLVDSLSLALKSAEKSYGENSEQAAQFRLQLTNAQTALQNTKNSAENAAKAVQNFGVESKDAADNTETLNTTTSTLISTIENRLVFALEQAARAGYEAVKSTEDAMVDIGRVLDTTASETEALRSSLFELGNEYGRSFEDVSDVALRFAQAGYNMNDTLTNTEALLLGMNTAELEASSGTTNLIGIMSQWGMKADELVTIIDKLNYTADNNAVTTQDLADALLKASSMAKTAGMNFNDTVGVLTALKVASGAAGKEVGNAFKSIMAYIQRPESLKTFENMGIEVFADEVTGELLPMMTILENMTNKWNSSQEEMVETLVNSGDAAQLMSEEFAIATGSLDEYNQYQEAAAAATDKANDAEARAQAQAAAGVYRRNYYIALMENFANAVEISKDLVNAEGHSMEENSRYMETLTAKTEQLIVALTELAVAAADSGLLDLAKSAIDTATAFIKWTTESKNLFPILASISGLIITIKSQKLASEIQAIGGAFGNAVNAIRGVETAASGATVAATGLSGALGAIGLAITAVSAVVGVINSISSAAHEARMEAIEMGKNASDSVQSLVDLYSEYETLRDTVDKTTEEEQEYKAVQDDIVKLLGDRAYYLDVLKQGTEEYNKALEEATKTELQNLEIEQMKAASAAKTELNKNGVAFAIEGASRGQDLTSVGAYLYRNRYAEMLSGSYDGYNRVGINMGGSAIEDYATLSNIMEVLNNRAAELAETYGTDVATAFLNDDMYVAVENAYNEISEAAQNYIQAETELAQTQYILQNGIPKTIEQQKAMEQAILDTVDTTGLLKDEILSYVDALGTVDQKQIDFFKVLDNSNYSTAKDALIEMAQAGTLNETKFDSVVHSTSGMSAAISNLGLTTGECVDYLNNLYHSTDQTSESTENAAGEIELTDEKLKELAKTISDSEKNITNLNKYMETLSEGNGLTAEQVKELCDTYGLLAEQFTLTENGYTIEISVLKALQEEQKQTAIDAQLAQAGYTESVINNILKRIQAYSDEVTSISTVAEAQKALKLMQAEMYRLAQDGEHNQEAMNELSELMEETAEYSKILAKMEELQNDLYNNLGKTFSSTTDKTKETEDAAEDADNALKALIETIERFGDMGVYSLQETIDKFEELRRTAGYTEDQIKSIEDKLHELYTKQVEEHLKATEQEKKDYIDKRNEQYKEDKEALEKLLKNEKEKFKEKQEDELDARKEYWSDEIDKLKDSLNAQIDASKKAYETKKKLSEKSYDNQISALESLRDAEISSIEAAYNARISALEKIKAARQAERDEEDYQDERAELLEQISYWEQRTGTEAVENLESLKKQLADLDKEHQRDLEDKDIDDQIDSLEEQRDNETAAAKESYDAQIAALKASKTTELEIYESTYNAEQELLKAKLEKDVKAMEDARDADLKALKKKQKEDLKLLEEEQEKKLKDLEDEKDVAIKAAEEKWAEIEKIFNDSNIAMIASAGMFASDLYEKFNTLFTQQFKMDLEEIRQLMAQLNAEKGNMESASGKTPSGTYSGSSGSSSSSSSSNPSGSSKPSSSSGTSASSSSNSSSTKKKTKPVQASTGGKTTADGLVMLHKNELIINPPTTKKLEDLIEQLAMPKSEIIIDPRIMRSINKMAEFYHSPGGNNYNTNNNSYNNSYNNSRPIVQNFNAPLQNIEKIEDSADLEAATNALERKIMRELSTKL